MRKIILLLVLMVVAGALRAQHIEDIRKELYPSFDPIRWSEYYIASADYYPVNYSNGDVSPKAFDFDEAFQGYYILDRFLRKRNRELMQGLDDNEKSAYSKKNKAWQTYRDKVCNKKWNAAELGYSMMVMNYLYCVNSKMRQHLDSIGGGIPSNDKLATIPELVKYKLGTDFTSFDSLQLDSENNGVKNYKSKKKFTLAGLPGDLDLGFEKGKLVRVYVKFDCKCHPLLTAYIQKYAGDPNLSNYDQITLVSSNSWRGLRDNLYMYNSGEYAGVTLSWSSR